MIIAFHLVQLGYFYTLYGSTEISQVDTRNAGEYGEAQKATEAGMILFNI